MKKGDLISSTIIGFTLYIIATGLSFVVFSFVLPGSLSLTKAVPGIGSGPQGGNGIQVDPSAPKTAECPLNGMMYTEAEKAVWNGRRPLAIMIENHEEARPQSGLSKADIVYEAVAEGGITRFMGIYYCGIASESTLVAPVRSARTYYLPWVLEYDALYNHVGGAGRCNDPTVDERAKALCQIDEWDVKDMDQFGISFPTCYRNYDRLDHPVATEHTMVCDTSKLYSVAKDRGWTDVDAKGVRWDEDFDQWSFKDDAQTDGAVASVSFVAWKGYESTFGVRWEYDAASNAYLRTMAGSPHLDLETNEQLRAKNVFVMFVKETGPVDEHAHMLYENVGSGAGILFQDGNAVEVTWKKPTRTSRTVLTDKTGTEVKFNRGPIWVEMLGIGTKVTY